MDKDLYLKIGRPQNVCVCCGAAIAEAGKHPSAIMAVDGASKSDEDQPLRQDYCPDCWSKSNEQNYFSFWLARREKPKPKKIQNRKERNATLVSYFDFLYEKKDPEFAQHLFFLAHLLMKYSVFKWVRNDPPSTPDGVEMIIFRNTASDDLVSIPSVVLEDERIAVIKKEIDEFLNPVNEEATPAG